MKREIKFRAWDKFTQKYWNIENWHFEDEYLDLIESADPNSKRVWRKFNEVELMQYTGFKDKTGREIYEGDILRDPDDGYVVGKVEYDWGAFVCSGYDMYDSSDYKVIGNIYENPELLEADK